MDITNLKNHGVIKKYHKGDEVIIKGRELNSLSIILSGNVIFFTGEFKEKDSIILDILSRYELFGEESLIDDNRHIANARALDECIILEIQAATILNNLSLLKALLPSFIHKKQRLCHRVSMLQTQSTKQQILEILLYLARKSFSTTHPEGRIIRISRKLLAAILLKNRETVGRTLHELELDNIIKINGMDILLLHNIIEESIESNSSRFPI
ncbi:Crp/Fnr family transcriptional regulator [Vibrio sp. SS-MA-C1-2]|uniref:Crp/Fnr family transcriptional regulator n=1 Tax=Vibrio sp. SS-MA-C1-2 TaxID=2908646 RepID=UPI001F36526A|nr:Crp/Fnr family transcriptional regulator [Vibrio sp. SS-MA-C1-2]UJF18440.1 Crp/Fnr family transcriptional regulator [Vibrio sp. SS-MA-C1-2]